MWWWWWSVYLLACGVCSRTYDQIQTNSSCFQYHKFDSWWHYQWCPENYLIQFHLDPPHQQNQEENPVDLRPAAVDISPTQSVFVLGVYNATQTLRYQQHQSQTKSFAYFGEIYNGGDVCRGEANQQRSERFVEARIFCCPFRSQETYIESIMETSQCAYLLSVCSPTACDGSKKLVTSVMEATEGGGVRDANDRKDLQLKVKKMFYHAYQNYMAHAFPMDNLQPISCTGGSFELGDLHLLTLIDTLDTLALLGNKEEFRNAVNLVVANANFDIDTNVSVFEINIRVLGGLLSAHMVAIDENLRFYPNGGYNGELLTLSVDLANRLLPAFDTLTGIPYGTVNLRYGVPKDETSVASTAGAGSLSVEFRTLSILTGNIVYSNVSQRAVFAIYSFRSSKGLVGKHIDVQTGEWTEFSSGIGSNSDSYYEYLLKVYVLFGDWKFYEMFVEIYSSILQFNKHGDWYNDVSMWDGCKERDKSPIVFENLASFFPGLQVLTGDFLLASKSLNSIYKIWRDFQFLPEKFDVSEWRLFWSKRDQNGNPVYHHSGYPLRPELIESTFFMHQATNDSSWLDAGKRFVHSLESLSKTKCGYSSMKDLGYFSKEDTMPSFFLSETCKYLYLLFVDDDNFVRKGNYIFTTEAHFFPVNFLQKNSVNKVINNYSTLMTTNVKVPQFFRHCSPMPFWHNYTYSTDYRPELLEEIIPCSIQKKASTSTDIISSMINAQKDLLQKSGDKVSGIRLDGGAKLGEFRIKQLINGFHVHQLSSNSWIRILNLAEPRFLLSSKFSGENRAKFRTFDIKNQHQRRCRVRLLEPKADSESNVISCVVALFGLFANATGSRSESQIVWMEPSNGCGTNPNDSIEEVAEKNLALQGKIAIVDRGGCMFFEKANRAQLGGAIALIVVNNEPVEHVISMAGLPGRDSDITIPVVMITKKAGELIKQNLQKKFHLIYEIVANESDQLIVQRDIIGGQPSDSPNIKTRLRVYGRDWGVVLSSKPYNNKEKKQATWSIGIIDLSKGKSRLQPNIT